MKKTAIFIMLLFILAIGVTTVNAEQTSITRSDFAGAVVKYLSEKTPEYTPFFEDIDENTKNAAAISLLGKYGILEYTENRFEPAAYMKNDEVSAALAKIFMIRCGKVSQYNYATFISNFYDTDKNIREYLHIAASLGLVIYDENNRRIPISRYIYSSELETLLERLDNCINTYVRTTGCNIVCSVMSNWHLITGAAENEKIDYFMTVNDTSKFKNDDIYIIFAKYTDERLIDVSMKKCENIKENSFYIIYDSYNVGAKSDVLCVYVWDSDKISPVTEKLIMTFE